MELTEHLPQNSFDAKYTMSREENVFLAKRNIVDIIWKEANLEGIAVTYPDTFEIYSGRTVAGLTLDETKAINNLKHAWEFVLDTLDAPITLALIRQVHAAIGGDNLILNAGTLRYFDVRMGGTEWKPLIPDIDEIQATLQSINDLESPTEKALSLFCEICRGQWFGDGNKRAAQLVANLVLIRSGCGILVVPQKSDSEFRSHLIEYYETGDKDTLMNFLFSTCLDGIEYSAVVP